MVVGVIGILSSIVIVNSATEWRRERVNTVAVELSGWLEQIRNSSLRETNAASASGGCAITLLSPLTNQPAGTTIATVAPTACSPESEFRIAGVASTSDRYTIASSNETSIIFTPRGSVITGSSADVDIRILLNGSSFMRCVRVTATLGAIRIGRNDSATGIASTCPDASFGGIF